MVVATGITSVVTQLLTIREYLTQFEGNEFVIALILFVWLAVGGIGTLAARGIADRMWVPRPGRLAALSLVLSAMPPVHLLAIRMLRNVVFVQGSSVGFYPTLLYIFATAAPYSFLVGFALPYSLFLLRRQQPDYPGTRIYIVDNLGDVAGGALFTFVLVYWLTPLQAAMVCGWPLVLAAWRLAKRKNHRAHWIGAAAILAALIPAAALMIEQRSFTPDTGALVHYEESRFGRVTLHRSQGLYTLFLDGQPVMSTQDTAVAEEMVHYPLAQVETVRDILLISLESGMLVELSQYRPRTVDYVELDPAVSRIIFQYGLARPVDGLNIINADGRAFLAQTARSYDGIIVSLPEPETFQINRFFTSEFFALVRQRLSSEGVLGFAVDGFDNYLSEAKRLQVSSLFHTAKQHFKHVLMLPGQKIYFVCADRPLSAQIPSLLAAKRIRTQYVADYFHGNITTERIDYLRSQIDDASPHNRDAAPQLIRIMFSQWFAKFNASPAVFAIVVLVLTIGYLFRIQRQEFVLFSTACVNMGSEILVIFAFEIYFGYIYFQIGLIVTIFLAGLLPGALIGRRLTHRGIQTLLATDALLVLQLALMLLAITTAGARLPEAVFLGFGFVISIICGCQFPVILHLIGNDNPAAVRSFSADLIGAAAGLLLTSVILLPYLGLAGAVIGLIGLKTVSMTVVRFGYDTINPSTLS